MKQILFFNCVNFGKREARLASDYQQCFSRLNVIPQLYQRYTSKSIRFGCDQSLWNKEMIIVALVIYSQHMKVREKREMRNLARNVYLRRSQKITTKQLICMNERYISCNEPHCRQLYGTSDCNSFKKYIYLYLLHTVQLNAAKYIAKLSSIKSLNSCSALRNYILNGENPFLMQQLPLIKPVNNNNKSHTIGCKIDGRILYTDN